MLTSKLELGAKLVWQDWVGQLLASAALRNYSRAASSLFRIMVSLSFLSEVSFSVFRGSECRSLWSVYSEQMVLTYACCAFKNSFLSFFTWNETSKLPVSQNSSVVSACLYLVLMLATTVETRVEVHSAEISRCSPCTPFNFMANKVNKLPLKDHRKLWESQRVLKRYSGIWIFEWVLLFGILSSSQASTLAVMFKTTSCLWYAEARKRVSYHGAGVRGVKFICLMRWTHVCCVLVERTPVTARHKLSKPEQQW